MDLFLLADTDGAITMSMHNLSARWQWSKATALRFIVELEECGIVIDRGREKICLHIGDFEPIFEPKMSHTDLANVSQKDGKSTKKVNRKRTEKRTDECASPTPTNSTIYNNTNSKLNDSKLDDSKLNVDSTDVLIATKVAHKTTAECEGRVAAAKPEDSQAVKGDVKRKKRRDLSDPLAYYREHYDGMPRGKLGKKDPALYKKLRDTGMIQYVPTQQDKHEEKINEQVNKEIKKTEGENSPVMAIGVHLFCTGRTFPNYGALRAHVNENMRASRKLRFYTPRQVATACAYAMAESHNLGYAVIHLATVAKKISMCDTPSNNPKFNEFVDKSVAKYEIEKHTWYTRNSNLIASTTNVGQDNQPPTDNA